MKSTKGTHIYQGAFQWYQEFGMGHHGLGDLDGTNKTKQNLQVPSQIS